jgi:RimJ/RimL family protein N-acetyltransferase
MILGEQVRLRAIERDDLPRFVEWLNHPEVRRGLARYQPLSLAEEERWFEAVLQAPPEERPFSIDVRQGEGWQHIGGTSLMRIDAQARHAEVGIHIGDTQFWNQGLGTQAMRLILRHAFETLNLNRVYLRVYEDNARALSVYRRLGFKDEGRLREDRFLEGRYWDTLLMGLLRREWMNSQKGRD